MMRKATFLFVLTAILVASFRPIAHADTAIDVSQAQLAQQNVPDRERLSADSDDEQSHSEAEDAQLAQRQAHEAAVRAAQFVAPSTEPVPPQQTSRGGRAIHTVGSPLFCDYGSLQDAVDAASFGDEIQISASTFTGISATVNINKELTIVGGWTFSAPV